MSFCNVTIANRSESDSQLLSMFFDSPEPNCILAAQGEFKPYMTTKECIAQLEEMIRIIKLIDD
jgi:hypothetical protein